MEYKLLSGIKAPSDVKKMNTEQLNELCFEIRQKMLETVSKKRRPPFLKSRCG